MPFSAPSRIAFQVVISLSLLCATATPVKAVDYVTEIKPILAEKCYSCHGRLKQESGLRLETRSLMIDGGAIAAGEPDASELLHRVAAMDDTRMPPHGEGSALKDSEVQLLRRWIADGAEAPPESVPAGPSEHWAFRPITPPVISLPDPAANPIDVLLGNKRSELALTTTGTARRSILLRRLYLDLVGLPPTAEQLDDDRPWEAIVDELLLDQKHGERWARHWMDVWRYADWYGLGKQLRYSQKHLWHWRDWIVESLNADKGYDRMIQEMLAGDELAPNDPDVVRATGFLARNYYLFNRTTWLDNTIEHTSKAFFGLTVNCAKCHDHKYDPVTQMDYYKMRAIFEPHQVRLDPLPGVSDFEKDGLPRVFDDHTDAQTYLHVRGDPKNPDKETHIEPGVPSFLSKFQPRIKSIALPLEAYFPGAREYVQNDHVARAKSSIAASQKALQDAEQKLAQSRNQPTDSPPVDDAPFQLTDNFDSHDPKVWKLIGNGWKYSGGSLRQTQASRDKAMVRLLKKLPADFELDCRFTTTGGATYKSVTFRFDQSDDGKFANYVYTSAHSPGPKVQVAFTRNGKSTYPGEGRKSSKIQVGQPYRLRFAVRGTLVNVWLDDEFVIAYHFPNRKSDGFLSLSGFDATVAFDEIRIQTLDPKVELADAKNPPITSLSDAESAVKIAEAKLAADRAQLDSIRATIAADNAKYRTDDSNAETIRLAKVAASKQARWLLAQANHLQITNAKQAKSKRDRAEKRLAAIENDDFSYQSIRGAKKSLETPAHKEADYPATYSSNSTGRRLALARWATDPLNPLTARVAVNQVWMRHFGKPLVDSVFDFGLRAPKPIHSDVLDYLAYEFIRSGWSFRHLHRLIVLSEAYQLSSKSLTNAAESEKDPENEYYWRANTRRMESQVVRDSLLHLAGDLDLTMGGPSVNVNRNSKRRSLYFKHSRDDQDLFLTMFDDADLLQCYRRSESVVPQQALAMVNSKLAINVSQQIAERIATNNMTRGSFIKATFRLLLSREPTDAEIVQCNAFFDQMHELLADLDSNEIAKQSRSRFVHAMINHNDFVSIR